MALPKRPSFGGNEEEAPQPFGRQSPPAHNTTSHSAGNNYAAPDIYGTQEETDIFAESEPEYQQEYVEADAYDEPVSIFDREPEQGSNADVFQTEYDEEEYDEDDEIAQELASLDPEIQESVELLMQEIMSDDSSEVIMNGPDSIHCKRSGQRIHLTDINFRNAKIYHQVINKFVLEYCDTNDRINDALYLVEGQLEIQDPDDLNSPPMVARVHIIAPPAVKHAKVTIAKKARHQYTLENLFETNAMSPNMYEFIKVIARGKLTTVISGLSGSGKTTLLEAMSYYFDPDDRVIVAEDTLELRFPLPDVVNMVSSKPKPGDQKSQTPVSLEWLVAQANRMRPDRIIVGETRGAELAEFLIAANSGADGSMTTLHAQDPERTWIKMANLASKAEGNRSEMSIVRDIADTIQIIIQMALIDGSHVITHISEVSNTVVASTGKISLNPLFIYDRNNRTWSAKGRPSEEIKSFLSSRGVSVNLGWFQK